MRDPKPCLGPRPAPFCVDVRERCRELCWAIDRGRRLLSAERVIGEWEHELSILLESPVNWREISGRCTWNTLGIG